MLMLLLCLLICTCTVHVYPEVSISNIQFSLPTALHVGYMYLLTMKIREVRARAIRVPVCAYSSLYM